MATMAVTQTETGNSGHLDPVSITELNVHNKPDFVARHYARGNGGDKLQHGFGFVFAPIPKRGLHKARVMVLDFSRWKIRHIVHALCKSNLLPYFDEQQNIIPP